MVNKSPEPLDGVFHALADPTRRAMLQELAAGPRTVGELAAPFAISLAGASKHIQVLERAGLIQREIQGRVHTCRLEAQPLHAGAEWLRHYERFWNRKLDVLEALLKAEDANVAAARHVAQPDAARPAARQVAATPAAHPRTPRRKP